MTAAVLVHADGGACHGTPIVDGRCPKCGIAPDTQSVELWPARDERRPCGGWVDMMARGNWLMIPQRAEALEIGSLWAKVYTYDGERFWWSTCFSDPSVAQFVDGSFDAAKLAAEDALRAVAAEILRAVGA